MRIVSSFFALIVLMMGVCCCNIISEKQSDNRYEIIKEELTNNKILFDSVAKKMMSYEYPIIYVENKNIIHSGEQTINSVISKEIFEEDIDGIAIYEMGYTKISKDNNGVYFYKYRDNHKSCGIMYYPNSFTTDQNSSVTKYEQIDENWYYFELS